MLSFVIANVLRMGKNDTEMLYSRCAPSKTFGKHLSVCFDAGPVCNPDLLDERCARSRMIGTEAKRRKETSSSLYR